MTSDSILLPPVDRTELIEPATPDRGRDEASTDDKSRRRSIIRWSILTIVVLVVFSLLWVGVRGAMAVNAAVKGAGSASSLASMIEGGDVSAAGGEVAELKQLAAEASSLTSDPVWRLVELVPVLGGNLTTVRESAAALTIVAEDGLEPLVALVGTIDAGQFSSSSRVDRLLALAAITPQLEEIDIAMASASQRLAAVDSSGNVEILADGFAELNEGVQFFAAATAGMHSLMPLVPSLASADTESAWLIAVTAGEVDSVAETVAYLPVSTGPDGLRIDAAIAMSADDAPASAGDAQEVSVDVAALQLLIEQLGPVKVPDVGEVTARKLLEFSAALASSDPETVMESELLIAASARSMIERLLG